MRMITSALIMILTALTFAVSANAETGIHTIGFDDKVALLHDLDDTLTEDEEAELIQTIMETARMSDINVAVVITDDIGSDKSDYGVMDYADVYYEEYCGMDTNGILLLINNDTKYDWISTSGTCIDTFYNHIDPMFDIIWHYLDKEDFKGAIEMFCQDVYFYTTQVDEYDYDYEYSYEFEAEGEDFFVFIFIGIFFTAIALIIFTAVINTNYKLKNKNAAQYVLKDSLNFSVCTDTFIRTYTTRTRINSSSSSSSGRSRSRSSGSRSHRSSGGGRHGGGGRRR